MSATIQPEALRDVPMIIAGEAVVGDQWLDDFDPSRAAVLCRVASASAADVDRAVAAAADAGRAWARRPAHERGALLRSVADRIRQEHEQLARLESLDTGKPLSQSRADINAAARYFEYYGCIVEAFVGDSLPLGPSVLALTEHQPYGVTGHIVPWNYPAQITARTVAPSLAVGNAVVVKPAEDAPLTPVRIAELALEAGLPAGTFNVLPGEGPTAGAALADHPGIGHLSFTGSVPTGRLVAQRCAARGRPVTLELGGKSPHVILRDADLDKAVPQMFQTLVQNAGQTCVAGTRAIVHQSHHGELIERLVALAEATTVGPGIDDPGLGPLISKRQKERVTGFVERALAAGTRRVNEPSLPDGLEGYFMPLMFFDDVDPASELGQAEVFGPVLAITPFDDEGDAVAIANGTAYGLTAAVWSQDTDAAIRTARDIEAGQVYVNGYAAGGGVELPFGGFKDSGFGREKGLEALREYSQSRTLVVKVAGA
jgi:aldehyde dehydrogenase (NAD+)/betaine-aldehyde dehydrogenase